MNETQKGLLVIMDYFDKTMRENGIPYSLAYGSALGAIRHKGFIPWDDDMDVFIFREDVERFVKAFEKNNDKFFLQKPLSTDWPYLFYKIRMNGTTAIEKKYIDTRIHQGLFIDVFVLDSYPVSKIRKKMFNTVMLSIRAMQTLCDGRMGKKSFDPILKMIMFGIKVQNKILNIIPEKNSNLSAIRLPWYKTTINMDFFKKIEDVEFEGPEHLYSITSEYDALLTTIYGDYMQPPPVEKRVGQHIYALDMEMDYKDWLAKNHKKNV